MVGISITSAPISRNGSAKPPDCLLARVVRIRHPLRGSSLTAFEPAVLALAAFLSPVADLFAFMVALALQLPARIRRSESCRRRATAAFALFRGPVSHHRYHPPAHAGSGFRPDGPPRCENKDGRPASQHTLLWAPGNRRRAIPAAHARNQ